MSHNKHSSGKGMRKKANPARKKRRERSYARLPEKRLRHVLNASGEKAAKSWAQSYDAKHPLASMVRTLDGWLKSRQ